MPSRAKLVPPRPRPIADELLHVVAIGGGTGLSTLLSGLKHYAVNAHGECAHPADSLGYVRANSQELSDEVCRQHIELYVNEFSCDLGDDGLKAIDALLARAAGTPA